MTHRSVLSIVHQTAFQSLDHLVLLHLSHPLVIHGEDTIWIPVAFSTSLILQMVYSTAELVDTVTLDTLGVEIAAIEPVGQIVNVVK